MQPVQRRLDLRHQRFVVGLDAREPVAFLARVVHVNVGAREALRRGRKVRAVTPAARAARARRRRRRRRGARLAVDERRLDARRRLAVRALRVELARDRLAMEKQRISTLFSWRGRRPSARARARASASASSASRCAISLASSLLVVSIVRQVGGNTEAGWICYGANLSLGTRRFKRTFTRRPSHNNER